MKLANTSVGELYKGFDDKGLKEFNTYIVKMYSSKRNGILKVHQYFHHARIHKLLEELDTNDLNSAFLQKKQQNYTLVMTYVNKLHQIIKEFVILSKIESKNLYTEVLWSEYLIENNMKRNLIINQANYKVDLFKDQYPIQKKYFHIREKFFLSFIKSHKQFRNEVIRLTNNMIESFEDYYLFQMIDYYKTYFSVSKEANSIFENKRLNSISSLVSAGISSDVQVIKINALLLSLLSSQDNNSFITLKEIYVNNLTNLTAELRNTISSSLINYCVNRYSAGDEEFTHEIYMILNSLYRSENLFPNPAQAHLRLGSYILFELKHGTSMRAKDILSNCIDQVSSVQRDSCEKLCLARIEFAEKNYEQARVYIDQGNTHDSLHYYPLFKTMLLKILIYLEDELRFVMERENLYKYLHKNKSLGEKNRTSYMQFYKYIDYMNASKFKSLSDYMRAKLKTAFEPSSDYFHDKEWMRERFQELIKNSSKE